MENYFGKKYSLPCPQRKLQISVAPKNINSDVRRNYFLCMFEFYVACVSTWGRGEPSLEPL